jgi:hypothetical protein
MGTCNIPQSISPVVDDLLPLLRRLFDGRYAIAVGGSVGKKRSDRLSDIDFRTYYDSWIRDETALERTKSELAQKMAAWKERGITIDGYWPRRIGDIDRRLDGILAGTDIAPEPQFWTIWGYHLPVDIANNLVIEDPSGIVESWKKRLSVYPAALKRAILAEGLQEARYWRGDYHYRSKVERGDPVFCMGLAVKLVHTLVRIVFALNETWYPGDGRNLEALEELPFLPRDFTRTIDRILFPDGGREGIGEQYRLVRKLIDGVDELVKEKGQEPGTGD